MVDNEQISKTLSENGAYDPKRRTYCMAPQRQAYKSTRRDERESTHRTNLRMTAADENASRRSQTDEWILGRGGREEGGGEGGARGETHCIGRKRRSRR